MSTKSRAGLAIKRDDLAIEGVRGWRRASEVHFLAVRCGEVHFSEEPPSRNGTVPYAKYQFWALLSEAHRSS
jgi:hypothetical protein